MNNFLNNILISFA